MKTIKTIFATILCVAAITAQAQQYQFYAPQTLQNAGTNNIALNATNTISYITDVRYSEYLTVYLGARTHTSNRVDIILLGQRSVDGTTFDTIDPIIVTANAVTNAGNAGYTSLSTNIFVGGLRAVKWYGIGKLGANGYLTNTVLQVGIKR